MATPFEGCEIKVALMTEETKVTIDGEDYLVTDLSEQGKAIINSLKFLEQEMAEMQARMAIFNTAKMAYVAELKTHLPLVKN